jgi:hypothetical protein
MRQNASESLEASHLEMLRRACTYGDQEAWAAFQQSLEETVLSWFHEHPGSEAACSLQRERYFVVLAFERLRQAAAQGQVACETLSGVLVYLRASLNGAILETLRVSERPGVVSERLIGERYLKDNAASFEVWNWLQSRLSSEREQRLAYLHYHCGLGPKEIVQCCPQEWNDVQEVVRLRRIILERLLKD